MFILSIMVFLTRTIGKRTTKDEAQIENAGIDIQNNEVPNTTVSDSILQDNNIPENETTETIMVDNPIENKLDKYDIGILSISMLFLVFTIISFIFFTKHQQKARKKVSK